MALTHAIIQLGEWTNVSMILFLFVLIVMTPVNLSSTMTAQYSAPRLVLILLSVMDVLCPSRLVVLLQLHMNHESPHLLFKAYTLPGFPAHR